MTPELKPCPFCGAPPRRESTWREGIYLYACLTPGCPGCEIGGDFGGHEAADWNRRTPDLTEALARLKALEEQLRDMALVYGRTSFDARQKWADEIAAIRTKLEGK